jgi:hypothetical protein
MNFSDPNRPNRFYKATSLKTPQIYECTLTGADMGSFLLFARTNDTVALLGTTSVSPGDYANSLAIGIDNRYAGALLAARTGFLAFTSNSVSGKLTNGLSQTGTIAGTLKANNGTYQPSAGLYSGTITLGACAGSAVKAILCPDGTIYVYAASPPDCGNGPMSATSFGIATPRGAHYQGTLNAVTKTIAGTFQHGCGGPDPGNFSMTRTEKLF